jgi:MFS family permease
MEAFPTQVGYIDLLRRNRSFRQLWLGQVVSQMGDWFDTIALYTIILRLTGSGRNVGLLLVARFVPSFLFGPISGVVADRFSRQRIMIVSDILRAWVVLGFLFVRRPDQLWIIYVLTVFQLGLSTFFEGIKYVKDRPRVLAALLVKPAWGIGGGILTILAVFGERIFPVGKDAAQGIGVLFAARGIGTAVGPIVARRLSGEGNRRMQASIGIAFLIAGIFYVLFGSATSFIFALVVLGIAHCGGSILWVFSTVILQRAVDDNFRGRVFAAELALVTLTMAASNYVTGELLDRFQISPRIVTVGIGMFFLLPGLAWFITQRWWDREERSVRIRVDDQQVVHESVE